ncbi:cell division protein FtsK, partial [Staphylococcus aureus]
IKKNRLKFQENYLKLEKIIEPMFYFELVEKKHIGRYLRYEFMPLKYKKRIVMNGEQESNTIFYDTKIAITHQIT